MPIIDLTTEQLENLARNYRAKGLTEGGIFSLAEVLLELKRRKPIPFGVREVAAKIVELAQASHDGLVTYGEIWHAFRPNDPWQGHRNLRIVSDSLDRVVEYCVRNRLPILTVLVVQAANRELSSQAVTRICEECRDLGLTVGLDQNAFIGEQMQRSREIVINRLPSDE